MPFLPVPTWTPAAWSTPESRLADKKVEAAWALQIGEGQFIAQHRMCTELCRKYIPASPELTMSIWQLMWFLEQRRRTSD